MKMAPAPFTKADLLDMDAHDDRISGPSGARGDPVEAWQRPRAAAPRRAVEAAIVGRSATSNGRRPRPRGGSRREVQRIAGAEWVTQKRVESFILVGEHCGQGEVQKFTLAADRSD